MHCDFDELKRRIMTTDELREEIGVQVEKDDQWTDEYVLKLEAECMRLKDLIKNHGVSHHVSESDIIHKCKTCGGDNSQLGFCARCDTDAYSR